MKDEIPEEYPFKMNDESLIKTINEYSKKATMGGRSKNYSVSPSYWKEMVELGQLEINNRIQNNLYSEIGKLTNEIRLFKKDNKKSS